MSKPLLSIGMIVKNEIRSIEKCLKALQPLRDAYSCELVIADTGSSDGTREVAAEYADVLFDFTWIDDFAAARNAVMDHCSGTWYLTVDADEYLDPDLSGFGKIFRAPAKSWPDMYAVTQRNYDSRDMERASYSDFLAIRMARLDLGIRYQGIIHEYLTLPGRKLTYQLCPGIVLHHDGYAFQTKAEREKKGERNLTLLDRVLEENPDSERCLVECLESAALFPGRAVKYAVQGMELLRRTDRESKPSWDGILAARCTAAALSAGLPEGPEWLDWALEQYPTSALVRVDAVYSGIMYYFGKNWEQVIRLSEIYLGGLNDVREGRVASYELTHTSCQCTLDKYREKALTALAVALCKLDRRAEALPHLTGWSFEKTSAAAVIDWLHALVPLEDVPGAAEEMARALPLLEPEEDDQWRKNRWRGVLPLLRQFFKPGWGAAEGAEHPWRLLLGCDGSLGLGAKVMACDGISEAESLLSQIEDWEFFPPEALLHALMLGARIPAELCSQRPDLRLNLLAAMAQGDPDFARHMAQYPWEAAESLPLLQMQLELVTCALQCIGPLKDAANGPVFCHILRDKLEELSRELLPHLYSQELLACKEEWIILSGTHQFYLWFLEGEKRRAAGDTAGYLHNLRQGLKQAPRMKDFVEFLLDEVEKEEETAPPVIDATPELLALAEQVKRILSQFPPDDPAVAALKQSDAYQRVAALLEPPAAPHLM